MSIKKREFGAWFDYGVDMHSRTIYLGNGRDEGEINSISAQQCIKALAALNWVNKQPISMIISSPGGDIYFGNAIYDSIKASKAPVTGLVVGSAMSAAAMILQACSKRLMTPNSRMLLHHGTWQVDAHVKDFKSWAKEAERWRREDERVYLTRMREKNPKATIEGVRELLERDAIFTAEEAVNLGFADAVVGQK